MRVEGGQLSHTVEIQVDKTIEREARARTLEVPRTAGDGQVFHSVPGCRSGRRSASPCPINLP